MFQPKTDGLLGLLKKAHHSECWNSILWTQNLKDWRREKTHEKRNSWARLSMWTIQVSTQKSIRKIPKIAWT